MLARVIDQVRRNSNDFVSSDLISGFVDLPLASLQWPRLTSLPLLICVLAANLQFIDSDLGTCRNLVLIEERKRSFWRKIIVAGTAVVGIGVAWQFLAPVGDDRRVVFNRDDNRDRYERYRRRDGW